MNQIPTLYEWAGDIKTFETLFTKFYDKVLKDDFINSNLTENLMDTNEPMPKWGWGETGGPYIPGQN